MDTRKKNAGVLETILRERLFSEEKKRIKTEGEVINLEAELEEYRGLLEKLQNADKDGAKGILWNLLQQLRHQATKSRNLDRALHNEKEKSKNLEGELNTFYNILHYGRGQQSKAANLSVSATAGKASHRKSRSVSAPRLRPSRRDQSPIGTPIAQGRTPDSNRPLRHSQRSPRSSRNRMRTAPALARSSPDLMSTPPTVSQQCRPKMVPSDIRTTATPPCNRRLSIESLDSKGSPKHHRTNASFIDPESKTPQKKHSRAPASSPSQGFPVSSRMPDMSSRQKQPDKASPRASRRYPVSANACAGPEITARGAPISIREKVLAHHFNWSEDDTTGTESDTTRGSSFYYQRQYSGGSDRWTNPSIHTSFRQERISEADFKEESGSISHSATTESNNLTPFMSYKEGVSSCTSPTDIHSKPVVSLDFMNHEKRTASRPRARSSGQLNFYGKVMELQESGYLELQSPPNAEDGIQSHGDQVLGNRIRYYVNKQLDALVAEATSGEPAIGVESSPRESTLPTLRPIHRPSPPKASTPPPTKTGRNSYTGISGLDPEESWSSSIHRRVKSLPSSPVKAYSKTLQELADSDFPGTIIDSPSPQERKEAKYQEEIQNLKEQVKVLKQMKKEAETDMDKLMDELFQQAEEKTKLNEEISKMKAELEQQTDEKEELLTELLRVRNNFFSSQALDQRLSKVQSSMDTSDTVYSVVDGSEGGVVLLDSLSVFDVCCLLKSVGLDDYTSVFHMHQIDGPALASIDENGLTALDVKWFHQPLLLNKLREFSDIGGVPYDYLQPKKEDCSIM